MKINWFSYYPKQDGYGRYSSRLLRALQQAGVDARGLHIGLLDMPTWLQEQQEIDWSRLAITCAPPYMLKALPSRHWLVSMTEGSLIPPAWVETINSSGVLGVIVPCQHNADAFRNSGVEAPIFVVPGGTDPDEFPLRAQRRDGDRPYTFLTFADRNERKGWHEVWDAFYKAFGGKTSGVQDVRLMIKHLPGDHVTQFMKTAEGADTRILYNNEIIDDMAELYSKANCLVLPSRSEGFGMPHREASCMGIPTITQAYSGLADAHHWGIVVEKGTMQTIPPERFTTLGEWRVCDVQELSEKMYKCYENPEWAQEQGLAGAQWIRQNQTWDHSSRALMELIQEQMLVKHFDKSYARVYGA